MGLWMQLKGADVSRSVGMVGQGPGRKKAPCPSMGASLGEAGPEVTDVPGMPRQEHGGSARPGEVCQRGLGLGADKEGEGIAAR